MKIQWSSFGWSYFWILLYAFPCKAMAKLYQFFRLCPWGLDLHLSSANKIFNKILKKIPYNDVFVDWEWKFLCIDLGQLIESCPSISMVHHPLHLHIQLELKRQTRPDKTHITPSYQVTHIYCSYIKDVGELSNNMGKCVPSTQTFSLHRSDSRIISQPSSYLPVSYVASKTFNFATWKFLVGETDDKCWQLTTFPFSCSLITFHNHVKTFVMTGEVLLMTPSTLGDDLLMTLMTRMKTCSWPWQELANICWRPMWWHQWPMMVLSKKRDIVACSI